MEREFFHHEGTENTEKARRKSGILRVLLRVLRVSVVKNSLAL